MNSENPNNQNLRWKRILLINPNPHAVVSNIHYTRFDAPPLSLTYIASYLVDLEVDIEILDAKVKRLNYKQIKKKIRKFNPDIVGISVLFSSIIYICFDIAKIVKEINQNCIVVLGGRHPTAEPDGTLKIKDIDIVVRGEGELTFRDLIMKGIPEGIKGLSYKSDGKIIHNPDRELIKDYKNIRYPARNLTKNNKYKMFTVRFETIQTSRGCPHKCKFCNTPIFNKGMWRSRPVEKIISELKLISQNKKITDIFFIDENLTANTERIERLCERIIESKRNKEMNDFKFFAQLRVDAVLKSPIMIKKMAKAGFVAVFVGIESINEKNLKNMKKGFTFNTVLKSLDILHEDHMLVLGNMIIGSDLNVTEEDIRKEIDFMQKVDIDLLGYSLLIPFPGTTILKELEEKKLVITKNWSKYTYLNPVIKTYQLDPKQLHGLLCYSFKQNKYLNNWIRTAKRIYKTRGLFFILNPKRVVLLFYSIIKMKILVKKFINGTI